MCVAFCGGSDFQIDGGGRLALHDARSLLFRLDLALFGEELAEGAHLLLALDDLLEERFFVVEVLRIEGLLEAGEDVTRRALECVISVLDRPW